MTCISLLASGPVYAKTNKKTRKRKQKRKDLNSMRPEKRNFADQTHQNLSLKVLDFSRYIDRFFAGERADDAINKSQLRVATISTKVEGDDPFHEGRVRFNLVFPGTQEKLQLVIEGQGDEDQNADARGNEATSTADASSTGENVQNATTAAFRFITEAAGIQTSADAGVRVNIPPQIFAKLRFWKTSKLDNGWIFRPREELLWVEKEGFVSSTNLDFDRKLDDPKYLLRFINKIRWTDLDYSITLTNGPSLFHNIDDRKGLSYNFFVISINEPEYNVANYVANISYRQDLYKGWFFWELTPQVEFPRARNFHRTPSFTVKFEVVLGSL
jgi:hypothetical protein